MREIAARITALRDPAEILQEVFSSRAASSVELAARTQAALDAVEPKLVEDPKG